MSSNNNRTVFTRRFAPELSEFCAGCLRNCCIQTAEKKLGNISLMHSTHSFNIFIYTMPWKIDTHLEYKKAVVYSTVLYPAFPSCAARMSHSFCWLLAWHKIVKCECGYREIQVITGIFHGKQRK